MHRQEINERRIQAGMRLLPKSKRQLAHRLARQRAKVLKLRNELQQAKNPIQKAKAKRDLLHETALLRRMTEGAKKSWQPGGPTEDLSPAQVKARTLVVRKQLSHVDNAISKLNRLARKAKKGARLRQIGIQHQMLGARKRLLTHRLDLLSAGKDLERAPRVHPSQVGIQRVKLDLPSVYEVPQPGETIVLLRMIAGSLRRNAGESDKMFRSRLRAYTRRALVRFLAKRKHMNANDALVSAAQETIQVDSPAIEAEADAGGFVSDPVAEAVDALIEPVSEELNAAVVDIQPEVSESPVSEEDVEPLLSEAEAVESDLASSPPEVQDALEAQVGPNVFSPSGLEEAPQTQLPDGAGGGEGEETLPPAPPPSGDPNFPALKSMPQVTEAVAELDRELGLEAPAVQLPQLPVQAEVDHLFAQAEAEAKQLAEKVRDIDRKKLFTPKTVGGILLVGGILYFLTRRS